MNLAPCINEASYLPLDIPRAWGYLWFSYLNDMRVINEDHFTSIEAAGVRKTGLRRNSTVRQVITIYYRPC